MIVVKGHNANRILTFLWVELCRRLRNRKKLLKHRLYTNNKLKKGEGEKVVVPSLLALWESRKHFKFFLFFCLLLFFLFFFFFDTCGLICVTFFKHYLSWMFIFLFAPFTWKYRFHANGPSVCPLWQIGRAAQRLQTLTASEFTHTLTCLQEFM